MKKNNRKKGLAFLALCAALATGGAAGCGKAAVETPPESSIAAEEPAMRESTAAQELTLEEKAAAFRFEALQKIQEEGDCLYFVYLSTEGHYQLYCQNMDGSGRRVLFDREYTPIADFAVDGERVYLNLDYGSGLWMVDTKTLESREILKAGTAVYQNLNVRDGVLYLEAPNEENSGYDRYYYPIEKDGGLGEPYVEKNAFPAMPYEELNWILQTEEFGVGISFESRDNSAYYVARTGENQEQQEKTLICTGLRDVLGYDETSVYVGSISEPKEETPVTGEYVIGRLDRKTLQYEELLAIPCRIGLGQEYRNGPVSAAVLEDRIYSLYPAQDGMSDWLAVFDRDAGKEAQPELIGEAICVDPLGSLGEVRLEGKNVFCPVCGHRDWYYGQELTLTETFPGDGAINETLRRIGEDWEARAQEYVKTSASWDGGCIHELSSVSVSSEATWEAVYNQGRYLDLMRQVYDYGGGAHGTTARESWLFDRQTGKRLTLSDVVSNSEEEIKTMVADAFCTPPYYNEDEIWKERWQTVYDAAGLDMDFLLTGDGITFYFGQYEVASYAEGFPSVTIPFEQLEMKIDLSAQ